MTYSLTIKKTGAGEWIVEPDAGPSVVKPGDIVSWQIDASEPTTARLQFVDDIFEPSGSLNEHWVSVIQQGETLQLTVADKALPDPRILRRTYGYAVAVVDSAGTQYAIGSNPPPDLDVGG